MAFLYRQSFENNNEDGVIEGGGYGNVEIQSAGFNGIPTSGSGTHFAIETEDESGPYTDFGGYSSQFVDGLTAGVKVYFDPDWTVGSSFQYTVAANGSDGKNLRDFAFAVRADGDNEFSVGASTNASFETLPEDFDGSVNGIEAGWYTLQHVFNNVDGVLSVDLNLIALDGTVIDVGTLSDPADTIGENGEVGGNRYGWFTDISVDDGDADTLNDGIAVDNYTLSTPDAPGGGGGGGGGGTPPSNTPTAGNDTIDGGSGAGPTEGGDGADTITATPAAGVNATVYGGSALNDPSDGGDKITVSGEGSADVFGNGGDDTIVYNASGAGSIYGGANNDTVSVTNDADNTIVGGKGSDAITVNGDGDNVVFGGNTINDPDDGADAVSINGDGDNTVYTNGGDDTVTITGTGDNIVYTGMGNDTVVAGSGDDIIVGGQGANVYTGGDGADTFVYTATARDIITDFNADEGDTIDLRGDTYTLGTASDGSAALLTSSGGVIILQGVTAAEFSGDFVV